MSSRVYFNAWGQILRDIELPAYAVRQEGERSIDAVCRSIARRSGLSVLTCRHDNDDMDGSQSTYQLTLGVPLQSGGAYGVGNLWVAVPAIHSKGTRRLWGDSTREGE